MSDEIKNVKKKPKRYFWHIPEETLASTIYMAVSANYTLTEFHELLKVNTIEEPLNKASHPDRQDGIIRELTKDQAAARFRKFKKDYKWKKLSLKREKLTKKEQREKEMEAIKEKWGPKFEALMNPKKKDKAP